MYYSEFKSYYSPYFSTTLIYQVSVIEATAFAKQYNFQGMCLFFAQNEEVLD